MDQEIRNKLRNVVTQCRKLLENDTRDSLEGRFRIYEKKGEVVADPNAPMTHLEDATEIQARAEVLDHFGHVKARGFKPKEALDQLVREIAFTHLNRLCAYKMMEAREVYVGGQKFREAVSRGVNSNGVKFYLADHPEDERLFDTGHQDIAYRHFLNWLGGLLSDEIGVLFNPNDPANRLYPRQKSLDEVLDLLNSGGIKPEETELREAWPKIWTQDETIGWVYQYFTPKELRDAARDPNKGGSQAPRNSYELAFRNQFFTPRYVVEFLTDNTLGRIWYEMRKGKTKLKDQCRYMVQRPTEIFLEEKEHLPKDAVGGGDDLSQEELLALPVHTPHRPKKDPRELKVLDPACGSGHFLLYCFDLLLTIYEEAYADPDLGPSLQSEKECETLEGLRRQLPRLILANNLHGIDIDLRASQIAALALWLRCQRTYQDMGLKKDRPKISRSNFVCAEPMPGEGQMLKDFVAQLEPRFLGEVVEVVFDKMKLAGEAGALLKIEEEIRETVANARKQWVRETTQATDRKGQPLLFTQAAMDRLADKAEQASLFDLSDITDNQFFEQAESRVIETLRQYAEKTQNGHGLQRRLFADDAVRGFAFVDLCQKRYDVVLMNPPFGLHNQCAKAYAFEKYPVSKEELLTAFVSRADSLLTGSGCVGCIGNRTVFFLGNHEPWRRSLFRPNVAMTVFADLGYGVLDEALVEAAAFVFQSGTSSGFKTLFVRALSASDKAARLSSLLTSIRTLCGSLSDIYLRAVEAFNSIPGFRISYAASTAFLNSFKSTPHFEEQFGDVIVGLQTSDNFRFLRLFTEVAPACEGRTVEDTLPTMGRRWLPFAKGGEYSPYFGDVHLICNWLNDGEEMKEWASSIYGHWSHNIHHPEFYCRPGITFTRRTASAFNPRLLPSGCLFGEQGPTLFGSRNRDVERLAILGVAHSRIFSAYVELLVAAGDAASSGSAARTYERGVIGRVPVPPLSDENCRAISLVTGEICKLRRAIESVDECSRYFDAPSVVRGIRALSVSGSLTDVVEAYVRMREDKELQVIALSCNVEEAVQNVYQIDANDRTQIYDEVGPHPNHVQSNSQLDARLLARLFSASEADVIGFIVAEVGGSRNVTKKCYFANRKLELLSVALMCRPDQIVQTRRRLDLKDPSEVLEAVRGVVSFAVGCAVGRWDLRIATAIPVNGTSVSLFDPIPICPPATLQGSDGLPTAETPSGYPLRIDWDGILVDDSEHVADTERRVRDVLEVIWKDRADAIEREACELLGVKNLREYFRKPSKGGFWDDHVTRYSKSRRNAPIYWLLQSSKKNYAIWLYYHRLDKDLLFKALVNYVEPKIRLEASRIDALRNQKTSSGESAKVKRLAKEAEKQEDLLSELRDFEDKLRRAADLHLEPDLNDGVILNIAPLHELVPWKEAKQYWEELLAGKYEWSSIGKQLRQKGLVK